MEMVPHVFEFFVEFIAVVSKPPVLQTIHPLAKALPGKSNSMEGSFTPSEAPYGEIFTLFHTFSMIC